MIREVLSSQLHGVRFLRKQVMNYVAPDLRELTSHPDALSAPWPQPSPVFPGELPATVLHVPPAEVREFLGTVVARYLKSVRTRWPSALAAALREEGLRPVSDARLGELVLGSSFATLLSPDGRELDLTRLSGLETLPDLHGAGTLTRFNDGGRPVSIRIEGRDLSPSDGDAWELAKYFVLQGCATALILSSHPRVHFPHDAINAVTRTLLPADHWVRRLIEPHCYIQLPLNFAVLHVGRSVLHNDQSEIYTPFAYPKASNFELFRRGYRGYQYPVEPEPVFGDYGHYLTDYLEPFRRLVRRVAEVRHVPGDPAIRLWGDHLAGLVPGFPSGERLQDPQVLVAAVAAFMHNASVRHSADHGSYSRLPIREVPLRLRLAPDAPLDRARLVTREDVFRHQMATYMYFQPTVLRRLDAVKYGFSEAPLRRASREFLQDLATVDQNWKASPFPRLTELASSIQY